MPRLLQKEIEDLKRQILALATAVEERVQMAVRAIDDRDPDLAQKVIEGDPEIDRMEVDLEEEGLKILALHQPVAVDLRWIVAVLKINNDLERVGDLAANIARSAAFMSAQPPVRMPFDFAQMAAKAQAMLRKSLSAFVEMDKQLAYEVCAADDELDHMRDQVKRLVKDSIQAHPEGMEYLDHLQSVACRLERVSDHATNIAEDVIYMVDGEIVRHRAEEHRKRCEPAA